MLTEKEILRSLDSTYSFGDYYQFVHLGHPYSYLIDSRINIFKGEKNFWAIAVERLGYSPRTGEMDLEVFYYGNCLVNLDGCNNQLTNSYSIIKIESDSFFATTDGNNLNPDATHWLINGQEISLELNRSRYAVEGIKLQAPDNISIEEAARLAVVGNRALFRASDNELYKSIPQDLKKILVLDEWYHRDFLEIKSPVTSYEQLKYIYEFNRGLGSGLNDTDFENFEKLFKDLETRNLQSNKRNRNKNRPGSYETWQQIAKVIVTGDVTYYQPTLKANSHWKYWPDSGSL